jgi:hypothetical protein
MAKAKSPRKYPPLYEKAFPIVLGVVGVVLTILLIATLAVALRLIGAA